MRIEFPVNEFDLNGFIEATIEGRAEEFFDDEFGPETEFAVIDEQGNVVEERTFRENRNIPEEIVNGSTIFSPYCGPNSDGKFAEAVDGTEFDVDADEEDLDEEEVKEDDQEEPLPARKPLLASDEIVGYLIRCDGDALVFESARYLLEMFVPARVEPRPDPGIFGDGMRRFVEPFGKH